jgi:DNA-binding MarR family transcriptional regulator
MAKDPAIEINDYLMQMAENLPLFRRLTLDAGPLRNLTPQELHTITLVGKMGSPRMSELARRGHVTLGTMTVMITKLVKKGYVKRMRDEGDRRVVLVSLTATGRKINKLHEKFHRDMIDSLLALLTKSEQQQIVHIIRKVAAALG